MTVQALEEIYSPLFVTMDEDFGIAPSPEYVTPLFKLAAELGMIVDLPVVRDDDLPILVRHGLRAARDVDGVESDVRETDALSDIEAVTVRTPVSYRRSHPAERID
jgi:hypothetical protein